MKATPLGAPAHGTGEGCFLRTLNVGCVLTVAFVVLIVAVLLWVGSVPSATP